MGYRRRGDRVLYRSDAVAGHALLDWLRWIVGGDRRGFTATAGVDLAHMFDRADLHWHDIELLADFLGNAVFTAGAGQLMVGQFVDDFDTRKIGRNRFAYRR